MQRNRGKVLTEQIQSHCFPFYNSCVFHIYKSAAPGLWISRSNNIFLLSFFSTLCCWQKCSVTSTSLNILHWLGCDVDLCSISNYKNRKTKQKIYLYIIIHNTVKTPQHNLGWSHIFWQYMIFFETTDLLFLCLI